MKERILTAVAIVLALVLAFVLKIFVSAYFFDALILVVSAIAGYEMAKLLSKTGRYNHSEMITVFPVVLCVLIIVCLYLGLGFYSLLIGLALVVCFGLGIFLTDIIFKKQTQKEMMIRNLTGSYVKFSFKKALNSVFGFLYPSFLFSTMILLNHFELLSPVGETFATVSILALLFAFLIPIFTDTFAMFTGALIGGKKLCPKISPGKTVSGAIGGAICCVVLCASVFLLCNQIESISIVLESVSLGINGIWKLLIIVLIGSIICQLGDIFESYLKRKANVKDSGRILPGHGGMLDRFDSYIFLAPYLLVAFVFLFI